jgi:hypothetical protein
VNSSAGRGRLIEVQYARFCRCPQSPSSFPYDKDFCDHHHTANNGRCDELIYGSAMSESAGTPGAVLPCSVQHPQSRIGLALRAGLNPVRERAGPGPGLMGRLRSPELQQSPMCPRALANHGKSGGHCRQKDASPHRSAARDQHAFQLSAWSSRDVHTRSRARSDGEGVRRRTATSVGALDKDQDNGQAQLRTPAAHDQPRRRGARQVRVGTRTSVAARTSTGTASSGTWPSWDASARSRYMNAAAERPR